MQNFQDNLETYKRSFITTFLTMESWCFEKE